jgi:hypothetical protein
MTPTFATWWTRVVIGKKVALTLLTVAHKAKTENEACMVIVRMGYARLCEMRIDD